MTEPHWTDNARSTPIFSTRIDATGPAGNVFAVLGAATKLLRELDIPIDRIRKMHDDALSAGSYDAAIAVVERWFPIDRGDRGWK